MAWNKLRYEEAKKTPSDSLLNCSKTPYSLMKEYEEMIINEDYEGAKAITEVLLPLGYDTAQTHSHIKTIY
jgi:hypothetical protein